MNTKGWSASATSRRVLRLLAGVDWHSARLVDVGAGRGHLVHALGEDLKARGFNPAEHLSACDVVPDSFAYEEIACEQIQADARLPFSDESFEIVVSIEVIEHVENQFSFWRELARIAKPGAMVIVTTPNVLNVNSRLRNLFVGFPLLFEPLPLDGHDPRRLSGHIHPVTPYYLAYGALRAGLKEPSFHVDRAKASAVALALPALPFLWLGGLRHRLRWERKQPAILDQNRALLAAQNGWALLTSRTAVLATRKPSGEHG
jgi:SAM-dependent methyltransferase